jgi:uncharacterized protein YdaU (DUF1376 family)
MKAPWFPFYTGDFLASSDVQLMEAHEVGAYILLLAHSWQSDRPGYLPNDEGRMRRWAKLTAAQWAESKDLILAKWPVAEDAAQRVNPRLKKEADKQVELRELKAEAGRKSAERRARLATEGQQKANTNPTPVEIPATGVGEKPNYSQPQSQPQSTIVDEKASASRIEEPTPRSSTKRTLPEPAADTPLFTADNWPGLNNPQTFAGICADLRLPVDLDQDTYRATIQDKMRGLNMVAPSHTMRSWISSFFINEKKKGELLTVTAGLPTVPTPQSEYAAIAARGGVIAIEGVVGDQNMNRMKVASYQQHFPTAKIHAILPR